MNRMAIVLMCFTPFTLAMTGDQVFHSETQVLAVDVMIRDLQTNAPVSDLRSNDFGLKIDGKEREISYFSHTGDERRPLAMLLVFNLAFEGGLRHLSQAPAQASIAAALCRLAETDEVAVYVGRNWFVGQNREVAALDSNHQASSRALQQAVEQALQTSVEERSDEGKSREPSMEAVVRFATDTADLRPGSQVAVVYVSDGMNTLDIMKSGQRRHVSELLADRNISFSAVNLSMLASYAAPAAVLNTIGKGFGMSVTGGVSDLASQTGGVTVAVDNAAELGSALEAVISSYNSRYLLGCHLTTAEFQDGRRHRIEVSLHGIAARKRRVQARRSFVSTRAE